jgi:hypothetical protein
MEITRESLDGVLVELYQKLLDCPARNKSSRGATVEMLGVSLRLSKPRRRISRSENRGKPFSALGELFWYLARSDRLDFIEPYVPRYRDDAVILTQGGRATLRICLFPGRPARPFTIASFSVSRQFALEKALPHDAHPRDDALV